MIRMRYLAAAGSAACFLVPAHAAEDAGAILAEQWPLVEEYCIGCHNFEDWAGGVAFDTLQPANVAADAQIWEEAVRKVRGAQMPPPGEDKPDRAVMVDFMRTLERSLDMAAAQNIDPGTVGLHRLNRTEYANAIRQLLDLDIDVSALLPRDDESDSFDNIAEVLKVSPAFMEQYLSAARQVSVMALGKPNARTESRFYPGTPESNQYVHVKGLPLGTRGGMLIEHYFPADGEYEFNISGLVGAGYLWGVMWENTLIVTVDDKRVFEQKLGNDHDLDLVELQQAAGVGEINSRFRDIRAFVPAGTHRIGITFVAKTAAVTNEILHGFLPVEGMGRHVDGNSDGPRIANVEIKGPLTVSGVSETPSRHKLFSCRPQVVAEETACAEEILLRIAREAFRRPVSRDDIAHAMSFYQRGRDQGDFDTGIQKGLMAILASPNFLYRAHTPPDDAVPGSMFALNDLDLASRLSFFLWSGPPDEALLKVAEAGELHNDAALKAQIKRMLADPRADALVRNFAFQWLNVKGLDIVEPDPDLFPEYSADLVEDFKEELALFIGSVFAADASIIDLLTARHSFINERLAVHYGVKSIRGSRFQRVEFDHDYRRGLLGKGAFLMATSYANRTTPVLRGGYILEKFLGTPPAAPPPNVEAFPETQEGAVPLTVRERLAEHRAAPSCAGCHGVIDPLGLALENFDAIGRWRTRDRDAGTDIDASGQLADGTPINGVNELRDALVDRSDEFAQTFTEKLMTFALGRSVRYYDMPTVRRIVRDAARDDYRLSAIINGIVLSPAFRMDRIPDQGEAIAAAGHPPLATTTD
ncbi:MAG: DUF1592 domain-containing protein [Gammaproteobacteria bacterium]|nr:DUF1592 domain-containing protein [Gammaproteobacteria bacterium]